VRQTRVRFLTIVVAVAVGGCGRRIDFASEILWEARHESGDLSEWIGDGQGGSAADAPMAAIAATTELAHSGAYSVKLTNTATTDVAVARVWRESAYPADAYYSAWYYVPEPYALTAVWTIMQFKGPDANDPSASRYIVDIDVRSLPGGELILSVYDHRAAYLRSPTPPIAMVLPIGRWFQVEVLYRNYSDDRGRLVIWLDGQVDYDIARPFGINNTVYWSLCSSSYGFSPAEGTIYIDDAAVSLARVTPAGSL
jgi:hypothetical protein